MESIGPKGLIKKDEFVRVIIQCLYSLGYQKSATCLELESGISYKSLGLDFLESQITDGNWDDCINALNGIKDLDEQMRASALFLIFKQCLLECLSRGDDSSALTVLRKRVSKLQVGEDKVHNLAFNMLSLKGIGLCMIDHSVIVDLRKKLVVELERLLPPPIALPENRLVNLVEVAVSARIDSCLYHNSFDAISLYEDHQCGRDQIPTETVQVFSCFF